MQAIFKADYDSIKYVTNDVTSVDKIIMPYGHCKRIRTPPFSDEWWLQIRFEGNGTFDLLVTNPLETTDTAISKRSMEGVTLQNNGALEGKFYELDLSEEHRTQDQCQDYGVGTVVIINLFESIRKSYNLKKKIANIFLYVSIVFAAQKHV